MIILCLHLSGQYQLLCLCRAIIQRPEILIFDEATSSLDASTDEMIQRGLRLATSQYESSLLIIAHRLKTVADYDQILVLDNGRITEPRSPRELFEVENGTFRQMLEQDPEREIPRRIILDLIRSTSGK
jgi:ABC-type multidrug transport system fused ATPase/permease subunit